MPLNPGEGIKSAGESFGNRRRMSTLLAFGIFGLPYIFSWFTLRNGYSARAKIVAFSWLGVFIFANVFYSSVRPAADRGVSISTAQPTPAATNELPRQTAPTSLSTEAWATQESRDILGAFFIKPYLRQMLKDPDSMQDFQVVQARPNKRLPDSYKVTVFYRARNSFGALVPEQRTVVMAYNPKDDNHPWVMIP